MTPPDPSPPHPRAVRTDTPAAPLDRERGRVVVAGGGIAAVSLCAALRAGGFAGALSVLEAAGTPHDRPPLSKAYLAGRLEAEGLALQPTPWWEEQQVELRTELAATALQRQPDGSLTVLAQAAHRPEPVEGPSPGHPGDEPTSLPADRVVLATGGSPRIPPVPGVEHALTLRHRADADRLRGRLLPGRRIVVMGAGLIGSEVAATALELGCRVTVVDPQVPMWDLLGPDLAVWLHLLHRQRGITMVAEAVERIEADAVHVPGAVLPADTVVLATGLAPRVPFGAVRPAGLDDGPATALRPAQGAGWEDLTRVEDGAIRVDACGASSVPGVLAIGDCSARAGTDRSAGHWESARLDGEDAARGLLAEEPVDRGSSWFWSDRHGHHLEVLGSMEGAVEVVTRGVLGEPPFGQLGLADGVVVAAASVDDPAMIKMARRLVQRRTPVDPAALADPTTDLRRLARGR